MISTDKRFELMRDHAKLIRDTGSDGVDEEGMLVFEEELSRCPGCGLGLMTLCSIDPELAKLHSDPAAFVKSEREAHLRAIRKAGLTEAQLCPRCKGAPDPDYWGKAGNVVTKFHEDA